jgi:L-ascorbate metabolism protein UlaG (beta-lactamase superfamily)
MQPKIEWLGHDSFRLSDGNKIIYVDPWKLSGNQEPADVILITHDHFDHYSKDDIDKLSKADTVVLTPHAKGEVKAREQQVQRGDQRHASGVPIEVVPAYNMRQDRLKFHPNEYGGVGYVITLGGKRIYHTGDSDFIPEMRNVKCDILLIPVSGTYVMTADEAAEAANAIKPELAIPMHWDDIVGTWNDANAFKAKCQVPVEILGKKD